MYTGRTYTGIMVWGVSVAVPTALCCNSKLGCISLCKWQWFGWLLRMHVVRSSLGAVAIGLPSCRRRHVSVRLQPMFAVLTALFLI